MKRRIMRVYTNGKISNQEEDIQESFLDFYTHLYRNNDSPPTGIEQYIKQAGLPKFTEEDRITLNQTITVQEIIDAIKKMKPDKVPGPDGLIAKYYQCKRYLTGYQKKVFFQKLGKKLTYH